MSVKISGEYLGNFRVKLIHELSDTSLITDAPLDNEGLGSSFSPTDLVAAAAGSCVLTILGIIAKRDGINLEGMKVSVVKYMNTKGIRRISQLDIDLILPSTINSQYRAKLERAAHTCPVTQSLHPDVVVNLKINYE